MTVSLAGVEETGYLTAYPCGGVVPGVSNVNFTCGGDGRRLGLRAGRPGWHGLHRRWAGHTSNT